MFGPSNNVDFTARWSGLILLALGGTRGTGTAWGGVGVPMPESCEPCDLARKREREKINNNKAYYTFNISRTSRAPPPQTKSLFRTARDIMFFFSPKKIFDTSSTCRSTAITVFVRPINHQLSQRKRCTTHHTSLQLLKCIHDGCRYSNVNGLYPRQ